MLISNLEATMFSAILATAPLTWGAFLVLYSSERVVRFGVARSVLWCLTVWCALHTLVGLVLGATGHLQATELLVAETAVLLGGALAVVMLVRKSSIGFRLPSQWGLAGFGSVKTLGVASVILVGLEELATVLTWPIGDYDSLSYHMPTMATWYQRGSLVVMPFTLAGRYPYGWEVLGTLFLFPFGSDFLIAVPNLVAWLILGTAVYLLSVEFGAKPLSAGVSAALVLLLPVVIENINTLHVDLAAGAFFIASLYFALGWVKHRSTIDLALFVVSLALLLGTKTSGLIYGLVAVVSLVVWSSDTRLRSRNEAAVPVGRSGQVALLGWALGTLFVVGGFWYIRNLLEIGNPLGDLRVQIAGITVLPGEIDTQSIGRTTLLSLFRWTELSHIRILVGQVKEELGLPFALLVPGVLLSILCILRPTERLSRRLACSLLVLLAVLAVLYWTTPYSADNGQNGWQITDWFGEGFRYAVPFLGVVGVVAALGSSQMRISRTVGIGFVLLCVATVSFRRDILFVIALAIVGGMLFQRAALWISRAGLGSRPRVVLALVLLTCFVIPGVPSLRQQREEHRAAVYGPVVAFLDQIAPGEPIAVVASRRSYVFYGRHLDHPVKYAQESSAGLEQWMRGQGVRVLAVGPLEQELVSLPVVD